jgi:hypothetical protein
MRFDVAVLVASLVVACGRAEYRASYALPNSRLSISVALHQSHSFLAEYNRRLGVFDKSGGVVEAELFPDTGGYAVVNLYLLPSGQFMVRTHGNHNYLLNSEVPSISAHLVTSPAARSRPSEAEFLGAFDFNHSQEWRFIPSSERSERDLDRLP